MKIGIVGGSGLYDLEGIDETSLITVETPFGEPSDQFTVGEFGEHEIFFLPRHGKGHTIAPGELNHRANIFAMKKLGVSHVISVSAVGSLRQDMAPRDVVLVDQYFDRTKRGMEHTFFGDGIVAHVALAEPVCPSLRRTLTDAAKRAVAELPNEGRPKVHDGGTYVNMEGPAFSTKAESNAYRSWGMDVIGMTNLAEAKLCREAEICYATMAMVTDYDCWHPDHDHVTVDMIIGHLMANTALAKRILILMLENASRLAERGECPCPNALENAIITSPDMVPATHRAYLAPIIGKYLPA